MDQRVPDSNSNELRDYCSSLRELYCAEGLSSVTRLNSAKELLEVRFHSASQEERDQALSDLLTFASNDLEPGPNEREALLILLERANNDVERSIVVSMIFQGKSVRRIRECLTATNHMSTGTGTAEQLFASLCTMMYVNDDDTSSEEIATAKAVMEGETTDPAVRNAFASHVAQRIDASFSDGETSEEEEGGARNWLKIMASVLTHGETNNSSEVARALINESSLRYDRNDEFFKVHVDLLQFTHRHNLFRAHTESPFAFPLWVHRDVILAVSRLAAHKGQRKPAFFEALRSTAIQDVGWKAEDAELFVRVLPHLHQVDTCLCIVYGTQNPIGALPEWCDMRGSLRISMFSKMDVFSMHTSVEEDPVVGYADELYAMENATIPFEPIAVTGPFFSSGEVVDMIKADDPSAWPTKTISDEERHRVMAISYQHQLLTGVTRWSDAQISTLAEMIECFQSSLEGGAFYLWFDRLLAWRSVDTRDWVSVGVMPYLQFDVYRICNGEERGCQCNRSLWMRVESVLGACRGRLFKKKRTCSVYLGAGCITNKEYVNDDIYRIETGNVGIGGLQTIYMTLARTVLFDNLAGMKIGREEWLTDLQFRCLSVLHDGKKWTDVTPDDGFHAEDVMAKVALYTRKCLVYDGLVEKSARAFNAVPVIPVGYSATWQGVKSVMPGATPSVQNVLSTRAPAPLRALTLHEEEDCAVKEFVATLPGRLGGAIMGAKVLESATDSFHVLVVCAGVAGEAKRLEKGLKAMKRARWFSGVNVSTLLGREESNSVGILHVPYRIQKEDTRSWK